MTPLVIAICALTVSILAVLAALLLNLMAHGNTIGIAAQTLLAFHS